MQLKQITEWLAYIPVIAMPDRNVVRPYVPSAAAYGCSTRLFIFTPLLLTIPHLLEKLMTALSLQFKFDEWYSMFSLSVTEFHINPIQKKDPLRTIWSKSGGKYGLLIKCKVKRAGYWPSYFFAWLWTKT